MKEILVDYNYDRDKLLVTFEKEFYTDLAKEIGEMHSKMLAGVSSHSRLLSLQKFIKNAPDCTYSDRCNEYVLANRSYNIAYLLTRLDDLKLTMSAQRIFDKHLQMIEQATIYVEVLSTGKIDDKQFIDNCIYKTVPFNHQVYCFNAAFNRDAFALFLEPGLGKTKIAIDLAINWILKDQIDKIIVLCPASIKKVGVNEINVHAPSPIPVTTIDGSDGVKRSGLLDYAILKKNSWLITNYEEILTDLLAKFAHYIMSGRTLIIADESTRIKNRAAKITKEAVRLASRSSKRLILTGMAIPNGPMDFYSQFRFLGVDLGAANFNEFRNRYAILGGWQMKQYIEYVHLDELTEKVQAYSVRKTKAECLDLPPKTYQTIEVILPPSLRKIYNDLKKEMYLQFSTEVAEKSGEIAARNFLGKMVRLSQIAGSTLKLADGSIAYFKETPKLDALMDIIDDLNGESVVVWAQFVGELLLIEQELKKRRISYSLNYGETQERDRASNIESFQNGTIQVFVAHPKALGMGVTLTRARYAVFYSNSYNFELRYQAEDRCHRIGSRGNVTYYDITALGTVDLLIKKAIEAKEGLAKYIHDAKINPLEGDNY